MSIRLIKLRGTSTENNMPVADLRLKIKTKGLTQKEIEGIVTTIENKAHELLMEFFDAREIKIL